MAFSPQDIIDGLSNGLSKSYARVNVYDARDELAYQAKRNGLSIAIRKVGHLAGQAIERSADAFSNIITDSVGTILEFLVGREIAQNLGQFAGAIGGKIVGIVGMGLAGAISAGFAQADYIHQKNNLLELYRDELAASLGKPASQVTVADMETAAEKNPVIEEELNRARKQRNFAIPLAVVATLASYAAVAIALPFVVDVAAMGFFTALAVKTAVSMTTYTAARVPLQLLGRNIFGLHDETVNDRIVDIMREHDKGCTVTPEQVLAVFVKTNKKLDGLITKEFGQHYDTLPPEAKARAVQYANALVPVSALAGDINSGAVEATELVFAALGEKSGVPRNEIVAQEAAPVMAVAEGKSVSFQEKLGYDPKAKHAERVTAQASAEVELGFS